MPKIDIILDSTQISQFLECAEEWNLSNNENLELNDAYKRALNMGSYGHLLLETYYKELCSNDKTKATEISLATKVPERLELENEDIELVKERFQVYTFVYLNDQFLVKDPACVELGFSYLLYEDDDRRYILEGKIDHYSHHGPSFGYFNGQRTIMDHKFQLKAHDLYQRRIQFRNYALVAKASMFIINYIRLTKKVDKTTYKRDIIPFSTLELDLWRERLIRIFRKVELEKIRVKETGESYEHNWGSCENKYGYACQYTHICESTSLVELEQVKKLRYHKKEEWKPW